MSSAPHPIHADLSIAQAQQILAHSEHAQRPVVDEDGSWIGTISKQDLDLAVHYGFSHAPVKEHLAAQLQSLQPHAPKVDGKTLLRQGLVPELWELLMSAARAAEAHGWQLFLVGGAVRDLLLAGRDESGESAQGKDEHGDQSPGQKPGRHPGRQLIQDIDLVVDGGMVDGVLQPTAVGAGVELARSLQAQYPRARLEIHGKFQTAALLWHNDPILRSLWVDIATARTEFYPYPAANPEVQASSIQQDLYRRDFTINAIAIRLTQPDVGELLDFFGGTLDIQSRQIRALHTNSFIEDPTRIYRAVRFAVRLGFQLEPQTAGSIRHALASGIYQQIRDRTTAQFRAPALQTRLKAELKYILQSAYALPALHLLANLDALQCIHPSLTASADLWRQLQFALRLVVGIINHSKLIINHSKFASLSDWLLALEVIVAHVAPEQRREVAAGFQLPADSIERLSNLATAESTIAAQLPACDRPSQMVQILEPYDPELLLLIALRSDRPLRKILWRYLTHWSTVKPLLDGRDLKQLGYKPSPQFKTILHAIAAATLDGEITTRTDAIAFLKTQYPSP